ncbi:MAG: hypothetical protein IJW59_01445 [Clostridia bacterium]|nr:hypothetical protein [Clostridia bacterium]
MRLLRYENWKQKIPFDNTTYKEVKRYSLRLNSYERELMDIQINYYRKYFSLKQVMDSFKILRTKLAKEIFIKAVLKRKENILYIPQLLKSYFTKRIKTEFKDYTGFFEILLDYGLKQKPKNTIIPIVKAIMGEYYKPVMKMVNKYRKMKTIRVVQKTLSPASYENLARTHIQRLQDDYVFGNIYGRSSIRKSVPISIVDEYGYGQWVSKNVSYNTNRLFIYSNNNKLTDVALEHMIYFNVYPGYGYFYNTVVDESSNISFDNGASYLINGWAMYAMCHSKNSAYSHSMLSEGANITYHLLNKNLQKGLEDVYLYLLGKYTKAKALDYMLDYTQYPGHYMSYVLGAFATELVMQKDFANNPIDYLNTLKTINCGDFFALYSPKMQKKIAKTNITAKVSKKFNNN